VHISTAIPKYLRDRLRQELDEFPYGTTDDIIDILAYIFGDMMADSIVMAALRAHAPKKKNLYAQPRNLATSNHDRSLAWLGR
jgi:hypothetical protein